MMSVKMATLSLRKITVFWKKGYGVIIPADDVTKSKVEWFVKIVNGFYQLTLFTKLSILDIWQGFEYVFECL